MERGRDGVPLGEFLALSCFRSETSMTSSGRHSLSVPTCLSSDGLRLRISRCADENEALSRHDASYAAAGPRVTHVE